MLLYDPPNTVHNPTHVPIVGKGQRETGHCFLHGIFWKLYTSFLLTSHWPELSDMVTVRVYYKQPCVWLEIPLSCMKKRKRLGVNQQSVSTTHVYYRYIGTSNVTFPNPNSLFFQNLLLSSYPISVNSGMGDTFSCSVLDVLSLRCQ